MAIGIGSSAKLLLPLTIASISNGGGERKRPPIFISSNPSHINLDSLSSLYLACNHSPHRFPSAAGSGDMDSGKLAVAVSHSAVVVSVFADGGAGERDEGLFGRISPPPARVGPGNGRLVGFGRAISDLGLTASIYDVMVMPSLQRMGIGRMIVQRIIRMLYNKGIYDLSAICSEEERLFFGACGFGDDILGSTTMIYTKEASSNLDDTEIITRAGRKLLIAPPLRLPLIP